MKCIRAHAISKSGTCRAEGCTSDKIAGAGFCVEHDLCRVDGCTNPRRKVQAARYCDEHATMRAGTPVDALRLHGGPCLLCGEQGTMRAHSQTRLLLLCHKHRHLRDMIRGRWRPTYRLSDERIRELLTDPACWVCGKSLAWMLDPRSGAGRRIHVDHDHHCCNGPTSCGQCVRGLAHQQCNHQIAPIESLLAAVGIDRVRDLVEVLGGTDALQGQ